MKKTAIILSAFLGLLYFSAYSQSDSTLVKQPEKEAILQVKGMACEYCARSLKKSLEKLDGVTIHKIDPEKGFAKLSFASANIPSDETLKETVENTGFKLVKVQRGTKDDAEDES